jgi:hypothetical protein
LAERAADFGTHFKRSRGQNIGKGYKGRTSVFPSGGSSRR